MDFEARELEQIFRECFFERYRTLLVGGGDEPVYLASCDPENAPHRIVYREDYLASALHEVAHWCLAGASRRLIEDYGYWYAPDGRNASEQAAFERAEARPQALEWILSEACGFAFNLSADNLEAGFGPSVTFVEAVEREKRRLTEEGLPARGERYRAALARARRRRRGGGVGVAVDDPEGDARATRSSNPRRTTARQAPGSDPGDALPA